MGARYNHIYNKGADEDSLPEIENLQNSPEIQVIDVVCVYFCFVYHEYLG